MGERFGATVEWLPFDLHPEYPPEGVPRGPVSEQMQQTFAASGLTYNPPPVRPELDARAPARRARTRAGAVRPDASTADGRLLGRSEGHRLARGLAALAAEPASRARTT